MPEVDPIVVLATGQSNFVRKETYSWSPPANLQVWNWSGADGNVGTAFEAADETRINTTWAFAAEIAKANPLRQVLVVTVAFGRAISYWLPGTPAPDVWANLTANIVPALAAAGVSTVDYLLWWQGESDAASPSSYLANFETLIARFRAESWFPVETPIVIFGIANSTVAASAYHGPMNQVLARCAATDPDRRLFVYTAALPAALWDGIHMFAAGYRAAGVLAAHTVMSGVGRHTGAGPIYDPELARWGFGTEKPKAKVDISLNAGDLPDTVSNSSTGLRVAGADATGLNIEYDSFGSVIGLIGRRANGTAASPSALTSGAVILNLNSRGYGATGYSTPRAAIQFMASENWTDSAQGCEFRLWTTKIGTATLSERLRVKDTGALAHRAGAQEIVTEDSLLVDRPYTVATLPAGVTGASVWCSDCRVFDGAGNREGVGAGTGGAVSWNGSAWVISGTNVVAAA
nr:sialate O-acetylesterase [Rhodoplanes tepidamans]